jgi:hypothetical protein
MLDWLNRDMALLGAHFFIYVVWLLVPLLPAIAIYWMFPAARTYTKWNISGIAVKASGAAGFYIFLVGLGFFKFVDSTVAYIESLHQPYWVVHAPIHFVEGPPMESPSEPFKVIPSTHNFWKDGEKKYSVTLRFAEKSGELPYNIRLIFPEGEGFIDLRTKKKTNNTFRLKKEIDLRNEPPFEIKRPLVGGQNQPAVAGLPAKLERNQESNDRSR